MVNYVDRFLNSRAKFYVIVVVAGLLLLAAYLNLVWEGKEVTPTICYRIFATPENAKPHCGLNTGQGRFYGDICVSAEEVLWDFTFSGGNIGHFPSRLYIAGPTTESDANMGALNLSIFKLLISDPPLIGPESGQMQGVRKLTPVEGNYLLSKPLQFVVVALDDDPQGELCDWLSWIGTSSRSYRV